MGGDFKKLAKDCFRKTRVIPLVGPAALLCGLMVGLASDANAQRSRTPALISRTEMRVRRAVPVSASALGYNGATAQSPSSISREKLAQPWWPLDLHIPRLGNLDALGEPLYTKVVPDGQGAFFGSTADEVTIAGASGFDSAGWNKYAILFGTTHRAASNLDFDRDGSKDNSDECPSDPEKDEPGRCGCGYIDPEDSEASCTDIDALSPSSPGSTDSGVLRVLELDKPRKGRQVTARARKVSTAGGTRRLEQIDVVWALPRIASFNDYLMLGDDDIGQNTFTWFDNDGDNLVSEGEFQTYETAELAEEGDRITYTCRLQTARANGFSSGTLAVAIENNGLPVSLRRYAYPQFQVKITKATANTEFRIKCIARNRSTGASVDFFSRPFDLSWIKKAGSSNQ
jgi:hypothetical protein